MAEHKSPGGKLNWFLSWFETSNISTILWIIAGTAILVGTIGIISGITSGDFDRLGFAVLMLIGLGMLAAGFGKEIKANPPQVGVLTIWGGRRNVLLPEGKPLLAPYWPLMIDIEPVSIESSLAKAQWVDVVCKGEGSTVARISVGAQVRVTVELTFEPDYEAKDRHGHSIGGKRVNEYINRGGEQKIMAILLNKVEEAVRLTALRYEWEQFISLKKALSALLITHIAETKLRRLPRVNGKVPSEVDLDGLGINFETYENGPAEEYEDDILDYLDRTPDSERAQVLKEIDFFLKVAIANGAGDVPSLGIRVLIINVTAIEPTGASKEAADKAAAENKQREGERLDFTTERELIQAYLHDSKLDKNDPSSKPTITYEQAAAWARVNRNRATETITNVIGNGNPLENAAAILKGGK